MALDPQAKALMNQMAAAPGPTFNTLAPADARRLTAAMFRVPPERAAKVAKVRLTEFRGRSARFRFASIRRRGGDRFRSWFSFTAADG